MLKINISVQSPKQATKQDTTSKALITLLLLYANFSKNQESCHKKNANTLYPSKKKCKCLKIRYLTFQNIPKVSPKQTIVINYSKTLLYKQPSNAHKLQINNTSKSPNIQLNIHIIPKTHMQIPVNQIDKPKYYVVNG